MIVVANSSPLIVLARIDQLKIFRNLFDKVYIPDSVYKETVSNTKLDIQRQTILKAIELKNRLTTIILRGYNKIKMS